MTLTAVHLLGSLPLLAQQPGGAAPGVSRPIAVDLLIMFIAAGAIGMIGRRFNLATIPCYLLTGALLGPTALAMIQSSQNVSDITSLAVLLLMFTIGLHLDPAEIRGRGMVSILRIGVISTVAVTLVLWAPLGLWLGAPVGLAVAMGLAMSSTAVLVRVLQQTRESKHLIGRFCVGVSITQDLMSLGVLASLPLLVAWAGPAHAPDAGVQASRAFLLPDTWPALAKAVVGLIAIASLIALARVALPRLVIEASRGGSSEIALVLSAGAGLSAAVIAAGLGFSPELGAFIAGFMLASTPARHQLAGQLSPMRDLLMAVFFTAVGLQLNLGILRDSLPEVLGLVVLAVVVKGAVLAVTAWLMGVSNSVAARAAVLLANAGEFSVVVFTGAVGVGLFTPSLSAQTIATVVISLILTPILFQHAGRLAGLVEGFPTSPLTRSRDLQDNLPDHASPTDHSAAAAARQSLATCAERRARRPAEPRDLLAPAQKPSPAPQAAEYVIIAGFGVVGRALADRFEVAGIPFSIVDLNQKTIETQRRLNRTAVYGDISNPEVLEAAGIREADVVVLTIPDDEVTLRACRAIRAIRPDVFIAARTAFLSHAIVAMSLGADHVTVEEVATAEAMSRQVMEGLFRRRRVQTAERRLEPGATPPVQASPADHVANGPTPTAPRPEG
jgi:Kef-type K+ transport system membrane component KefB